MTTALTEAQLAIVEWLAMLRSTCRLNRIPEGYTYAGIGDFLLQHGVWFEPAPLPKSVLPMTPRSCFANAIELAKQRRFRYVEGYAVPDITNLAHLPMHHAWNLDRKGRLVDSTWKDTGLAYLGVEFSPQRAASALRVRDSVLDSPHTRFEIFKEPWTGEPDGR